MTPEEKAMHLLARITGKTLAVRHKEVAKEYRRLERERAELERENYLLRTFSTKEARKLVYDYEVMT